MEVGSPEWIEASLAKLDVLERQRGEHEAALETATDPLTLKQHNDAFERLDAEIKSLYAQLEAVAGEEEEQEEDEDDAEVVPRVTQGDDELSAPHVTRGDSSFASPNLAAPVAAPIAAAAESPFGSSGGGYEAPAAAVSFDDDVPKGGGAKWVFVGLVVAAGIGVGAYFAWQNMQAEKAKQQAKPEAVEEIKIDAAQIREDTEEPNAVKGADATISPTANGYTSGSTGGGGGSSGGSSKKVDEKKKKPLQIKGGGDPLTGGDPLG
jgi:hypothetical protein